MDDNELHYITYDPEEIMRDMQSAYVDAGGDPLYPGDEKEMFLRAALQIMMQALAGVDNALRMSTLRYAVRDYLDAYGEKRNCYRIEAAAATATVRISLAATGTAGTIAQGTALTADGAVIYTTDEELATGGYQQELTATVTCSQTGSIGNGLIAGTEMQSLVPIDGAVRIVCTQSAAGGQDREDDESYRERIRTYGLSTVSTGPQQQYEAAAKAVSSEIIDARALNEGAGQVGVYILPKSDTGLAALIDQVEDALNDQSVRPLTDTVTVAAASPVSYTLNVEYSYDGSTSAQAQITAAVQEYQTWQEQTIGRAFNPDRLMATLYQAGATRVIWGAGSEFDGGAVAYTEIQGNEYCKGTITLAVIGS